MSSPWTIGGWTTANSVSKGSTPPSKPHQPDITSQIHHPGLSAAGCQLAHRVQAIPYIRYCKRDKGSPWTIWGWRTAGSGTAGRGALCPD